MVYFGLETWVFKRDLSDPLEHLNQKGVAGGTPIKWEISTELGAKGIRKLFDLPKNVALKNIEIIHVSQVKIIN